jgi:hypothetical protein
MRSSIVTYVGIDNGLGMKEGNMAKFRCRPSLSLDLGCNHVILQLKYYMYVRANRLSAEPCSQRHAKVADTSTWERGTAPKDTISQRNDH